jgi:dienelactone hydrolase
MRLEAIKENPDGSADYMIEDLTDEEATAFIRLGIIKALETAIEDARRYDPQVEQKVTCKEHPDAPHGFDRNASHSLGRYVCECEGWTPDEDSKTEG